MLSFPFIFLPFRYSPFHSVELYFPDTVTPRPGVGGWKHWTHLIFISTHYWRHTITEKQKMAEFVWTLLRFALPSSDLLHSSYINMKTTLNYIEIEKSKYYRPFYHVDPFKPFTTVIGANASESLLFALKHITQYS